jgi:hypothetical protein
MRPRLLFLLLPALLLAGCQMIREANIRECVEFFDDSRDPQMDRGAFQRACTCAVEREAAGATPVATVPPRPEPALGAFRRHLPDCIGANGGRANGVAARESSGRPPRPRIFDPATGESRDPPGEVMPGPGDGGAPAPADSGQPSGYDPNAPSAPRNVVNDAERAIQDAQRDIENAMREMEGR